MPDLSVLIPARNEEFLQHTIDDVQKNKRGDSEIIVVLDGYWPAKTIPQEPNLTIVHQPKSIGQRGATNLAAQLSKAPYVMKLDAHCALGEGFDVTLLKAAEELGPEVLQVPLQYNLHVFDWACDSCGHRRYQSKPLKACEKCGHEKLRKEMVWKPRKNRVSSAWRFNSNLVFGYWGQWKHTDEGRKEISETLSLLGACWFCDRKRFWELDGLDEGHGGWGQMGTELACKFWLSGGRVVCNKRTWFGHMFRSNIGFPYHLSKSQTNHARSYSQNLWKNNKGPKAKHRLEWLIDRFAPVPGWEVDGDKQNEAMAGGPVPSAAVPVDVRVGSADRSEPTSLTKGVVYYSDCRGDEAILNVVRAQLARAVNGHPIVSSCLDYVPLGETRIVHAKLKRGYLTMFKQILAGLEMSTADVVFLAEHDVLYHPSHFDFTPERKDVYYYNENTWKVDATDGKALFYYCKQTSGLCAYRDLLVQHYRARVERVEREGFTRRMGFEPGTHKAPRGVDNYRAERWMSEHPNIDIRHTHNLTPNRWRQDQFRNHRSCQGWKMADDVPGWGKTKGRFKEFLEGAR